MVGFFLILLLLYCFQYHGLIGGSVLSVYNDSLAIYDEFPNTILIYEPRLDHHVENSESYNKPVTRGHIHKLPDLKKGDAKITYEEFHRILQCPVSEPALDSRGSLSLLKMVKPTRLSVQLMALYLERKCKIWKDCRKLLSEYQANNFATAPDNTSMPSSHYRIVRYNSRTGIFTYDWPWKIEKFDKYSNNFFQAHPYTFMSKFLPMISNLKDIFFFGNVLEFGFFDYNMPFPAFTPSPNTRQIDFVLPWHHTYEWEEDKNKHYRPEDYLRHHSPTLESWMTRNPKASFFCGAITSNRQMIFDMAVMRPDLFDVGGAGLSTDTRAWNPISQESNPYDKSSYEDEYKSIPGTFAAIRTHVGQPVDYVNRRYKYTVVLLGKGGLATADRLAPLIAHSGTVVLLQAPFEFDYHFSQRLKPWVHYVPIAYNTADVIRKVEWLNAHPELAHQIAMNAKIFGESYLRFEDYYCYIATLFKELGDVLDGSDALLPYNQPSISGY